MCGRRETAPPPPRPVRVLRANGTARDLRPSIAPVHAHLATAAGGGAEVKLGVTVAKHISSIVASWTGSSGPKL